MSVCLDLSLLTVVEPWARLRILTIWASTSRRLLVVSEWQDEAGRALSCISVFPGDRLVAWAVSDRDGKLGILNQLSSRVLDMQLLNVESSLGLAQFLSC